MLTCPKGITQTALKSVIAPLNKYYFRTFQIPKENLKCVFTFKIRYTQLRNWIFERTTERRHLDHQHLCLISVMPRQRVLSSHNNTDIYGRKYDDFYTYLGKYLSEKNCPTLHDFSNNCLTWRQTARSYFWLCQKSWGK